MANHQDPSFASCLASYKERYLPAINLGYRTRQSYCSELDQAINFLANEFGLVDVRQVEFHHLEAFLAACEQRGLKGSSRRHKYIALRSFFRHLVWDGVITVDPTSRLLAPKKEFTQPRVLSRAEYRSLRRACAHHVRDAAIIELLLQTGIRLTELSNLHVRDLEMPAVVEKKGPPGVVHINGKGMKQRVVSVNWRALRAVRAWLIVRRPSIGDQLFLNRWGEPLGSRSVYNVVKKYLTKAGIAGAHAHTLRHTFGTHMLRKGTSLEVLRAALGHASLNTTSRYIHLAREQMDKELQANAL